MTHTDKGKRHRTRKRCRSKSCVRSRKRRQMQVQASRCDWRSTPQEPSLFERYYLQTQNNNWLSSVEEQGAFLSTLRAPLPVCFRNRSRKHNSVQDDLRRVLRQEGLENYLVQRRLGGQEVWQLPAAVVQQVPRLKSWLSRVTRQGQVSRQELVSMIPVALLGIQSHHGVLDLCASPGSKTLQALDALYDDTDDPENEEAASSSQSKTSPTGFVLANELDAKRAYVLAHRCFADASADTPAGHAHRLTSLAVVCHNACKFPNVLAPLDSRTRTSDEKVGKHPFDRIICDVPCSGDGTLRKDVKAWKVWHPTYGLQLHALQVRIAKRGIALLRVGGLMTYSTCSFHPIENEAVVAALLRTGCVELVPPPSADALKGIRYRPGWTTWKVLDDDCQELKRPDDHPEWPKTCWPPNSDGISKALRRCIRMVPHDNDTGGFFIALLRKIKGFPSPRSSNILGNKKKTPMVTPQADHHQLYPVHEVGEGGDATHEGQSQRRRTVFTRGKTGKNHYELSPSLSHCLTGAPGSAKLNLVSAGLKQSSLPHF